MKADPTSMNHKTWLAMEEEATELFRRSALFALVSIHLAILGVVAVVHAPNWSFLPGVVSVFCLVKSARALVSMNSVRKGGWE